MHKRIMIVAGGDWQVPITKKAKEMGLYVISSNLYEDSPAFAYADAVKIANVLDREANLACAERYKPDAVVTDHCRSHGSVYLPEAGASRHWGRQSLFIY